MILRSIRWKLSLSFAGIALLTTLALGVALLLPLRAYYRDQEQAYLRGNAKSIALGLAPLFDKTAPKPEELEAHMEFLAFLSQARVRVIGEQGKLLADSGSPAVRRAVQMAAVGVPGPEFVIGGTSGPTGDLLVRIEPENSVEGKGEVRGMGIATGSEGTTTTWENVITETMPAGTTVKRTTPLPQESAGTLKGMRFFFSDLPAFGPGETVVSVAAKPALVSVVPLSKTMYGFEFSSGGGSDVNIASAERSNEVYRQLVTGADGQQRVWVELSEGPAYGREIVSNVARAWGIASLIAVMVAASAGWWISRRMSAPVVALTGVTRRMASGDLSARAGISQADEFGALGGAFNEMARRVEATVSTLRRFVADAAHELHTPLTALRTNLELAQTTPDPTEYLGRAAEQVQRLERLTRDLLDLSRIEGGSNGPEPEVLNLAELTALVCEPYAAQAEQAGVEFALSLPSEPLHVLSQESRLSQAIGNLVENALKFTPSPGRVEVGVTGGDETAELWVEDSGIGIAPEDLSALFQRFHRGRNAAAYPGSGLGLSIVKAVVDSHGGVVRAESEPGRTRFTITLPTVKSE